jgi:hypothetical protein
VAHHKHSIHSSEREEYVEYIFLAELCSYAWSVDRFVEVARAHTDAFGYDLLLSSNGIIRHLQLKSSVVGGRTRNQKVSLALEKKESGCVIWIKLDETTLKPHGYGWFGGSVGLTPTITDRDRFPPPAPPPRPTTNLVLSQGSRLVVGREAALRNVSHSLRFGVGRGKTGHGQSSVSLVGLMEDFETSPITRCCWATTRRAMRSGKAARCRSDRKAPGRRWVGIARAGLLAQRSGPICTTTLPRALRSRSSASASAVRSSGSTSPTGGCSRPAAYQSSRVRNDPVSTSGRNRR